MVDEDEDGLPLDEVTAEIDDMVGGPFDFGVPGTGDADSDPGFAD